MVSESSRFVVDVNRRSFIATDLERLVQKLGTPEDSEPLRER
jgi:hypothetical protein